MTATLPLALLVSVGLLALANLALTVWIWHSVRALPKTDVARSLEGLLREQSALREAIERLGNESQTGNDSQATRARTHRFDRAEASAVAGPTLIAVPNLAAPPPPTAIEHDELAQRFGTIWSLADAGASAGTIAQRTGQPIGQVELVLGLRRQLAAQSGSPARSRGRN